jgi:hypothetical protein
MEVRAMTAHKEHVHIEPRGARTVLRYDDGRIVIVGTRDQLEAVLFGAPSQPLPRLYEKPGMLTSEEVKRAAVLCGAVMFGLIVGAAIARYL